MGLSCLMVLIGSISYGVLSTLTKFAYAEGFTPAQVVCSQNFFGLLTFWCLGLLHWRRLLSVPVPTILMLLGGGALSGLTGVFYYQSLQQLPASYAIILLFQFTWIGLIVDWLWRKRRPGAWRWLALICILVGTVLAAGVTGNHNLSVAGIVLGLLAAVAYTVFINFSGHAAPHLPVLVRNTWMVTGAFLVSVVIFSPNFLMDGSLARGMWRWGSAMGFFGMVLPVYLFGKGVPRIGAGLSSLLGSAELPVVMIASTLLLHEQVSWIQVSGVAIIIGGIAISLLDKEPGTVVKNKRKTA
jgi:drug/metabolite transporter (DMT)-like permease